MYSKPNQTCQNDSSLSVEEHEQNLRVVVTIRMANADIAIAQPLNSGSMTCFCIIEPPVLLSSTKHGSTKVFILGWFFVRGLYRTEASPFVMKSTWLYYLVQYYANCP